LFLKTPNTKIFQYLRLTGTFSALLPRGWPWQLAKKATAPAVGEEKSGE